MACTIIIYFPRCSGTDYVAISRARLGTVNTHTGSAGYMYYLLLQEMDQGETRSVENLNFFKFLYPYSSLYINVYQLDLTMNVYRE